MLSWPSQKRVRTSCVSRLTGASTLVADSPKGSSAGEVGDLRSLSRGAARPIVAEEAVVEVVGQSVSDVGGDAGGEIPRQLRTVGNGGGRAEFVAGQQAADVHLVAGGADHFVVTE